MRYFVLATVICVYIVAALFAAGKAITLGTVFFAVLAIIGVFVALVGANILLKERGKPITLKGLKKNVWYSICATMKYTGEPNLGFRNLLIIRNGKIVALENDLPEEDLHRFMIKEFLPFGARVIFMRRGGGITAPCNLHA